MSNFTDEEIEEQTKRRNRAQSEHELAVRKADNIRWKENDRIRQQSEDNEMMANFYRNLK